MTDILFVHNNFPGQYRLLASRLAGSGEFRVAAIGSATATEVPGVLLQRYQSPDASADDIHCFARRFEGECRRTEQVFYAASALKATGIRPKLIFAHPGWGETLALKHAFPDAKMCLYAEFHDRPKAPMSASTRSFPTSGRTAGCGFRCGMQPLFCLWLTATWPSRRHIGRRVLFLRNTIRRSR